MSDYYHNYIKYHIKNCIKNTVSFFFFFLCVHTIHAQNLVQDTIELKDSQSLLSIGKEVYFLEDETGKLTIEDIQQKNWQQKFELSEQEVFARPMGRSAYWFKFTFQNICNEDAWLEVGSIFVWYLDFYAPDANNQYLKPIQTGSLRPADSKAYDVDLFWLPLNKAGDSQPKTYYLRLSTEFPPEFPLHIGTIRALQQNKDIHDYLTAGFVGILLIMFLYNGFLFLSTRDTLYLMYLGYIFVAVFAFTFLNNHPLVYIFTSIPRHFWHQYFVVWITWSNLFVGLFCIRFLNLSQKLPRVRWLILGELFILMLIFPIIRILGVSFVDLGTFQQITVTIFYFTCLFSGYYLIYKKDRQARYYALAWTSVQVSVFMFLAVINGGIDFNPFTRNVTYFGIGLEVWLFSLALGDRINILRKQQAETQVQLLEKSRENEELISKQNQILEQKVLVRTQELQESQEEILMQNEELRQTQEELEAQRDFLDNQNADLHHKNHQITTSIRAAQTIQQAILPSPRKLEVFLKDYFIIYRPKDVVSGDFYWLHHSANKIILVMADCTGHGVPGAFMTLISNDLLNKIVRVRNLENPADILNNLHYDINRVLHHNKTYEDYGMDASIITFKNGEVGKVELSFEGAKNNLLYHLPDSQELHKVKGTRKSIGGKYLNHLQFKNQSFKFPKGTQIYLGSDGFADQNDVTRRKFSSRRLRELLLANAHLPLTEQKQKLEEALNKHMKDTEQRDDISLLGFRL